MRTAFRIRIGEELSLCRVRKVPKTKRRRIAAVEAEIEELGEKLKARKAELKTLAREKAKADAAAAAKKAEEDKAAILAAVEASGKSLEEILALLK